MLRRVEPLAVTVWAATLSPCRLTLLVREATPGSVLVESRIVGDEEPPPKGPVLLQGGAVTVPVGDKLHVACVTARSRGRGLAEGRVYEYDLRFADPDEESEEEDASRGRTRGDAAYGPGLLDPRVTDGEVSLAYEEYSLPTFVVPASGPSRWRILHASCRKPHGAGLDALPVVDALLASAAKQGKGGAPRPQQLFLTGDQIYADDVAAPLLTTINRLARELFGADEELPPPAPRPGSAERFPFHRTRWLKAVLSADPGAQQCHLTTLAEFCGMYLLAWSDSVWPAELPAPEEVAAAFGSKDTSAPFGSSDRRKYAEQSRVIDAFRKDVPAVRRALANVATYMQLDDHEVTDDWNLDRTRTATLLSVPLGRRIVKNALLAYALFQAWGNAPRQFEDGPGADLLVALRKKASAAAKANKAALAAAETAIERALGLPPLPRSGTDALFEPTSGGVVLRRPASALRYSFDVTCAWHRVVVLDTRTRRLFGSDDVMGLIAPDGLDEQLPLVRAPLTLVLSPAPPTNVRSLELAQLLFVKAMREAALLLDAEPWSNHGGCLRAFVDRLREIGPAIVLSGDVHYGFAARIRPRGGGAPWVASFTSSALKNRSGEALCAALAGAGAAPFDPLPPSSVDAALVKGSRASAIVTSSQIGDVTLEVDDEGRLWAVQTLRARVREEIERTSNTTCRVRISTASAAR